MITAVPTRPDEQQSRNLRVTCGNTGTCWTSSSPARRD